jgi:hypothetical protein
MLDLSGPRLKIERAKKHILDLNELLDRFVKSDFYSVRVELYRGQQSLWFEIDKSGFSATQAALIIGDALHNLKSSLDIMFNEIVEQCTNSPPAPNTRFPVRNTREEFAATIYGALKEQRISGLVYQLFMDSICPYEAGNYALWGLHKLNIADKHKLLIPVIRLLRFTGLRLENEKNDVVNPDIAYFMDETGRFVLDTKGNLTLKNKGKAAATILFDVGLPYPGQPVIVTLNGIAEEVTRTLEAFQSL